MTLRPYPTLLLRLPRAALCGLLLLVIGSGCATTMKPTHPPTDIVAPVGQANFRFDGKETNFREPGMPVAGGNLWRREVGNFTATRLNDLLNAPEDAPVAKTVVSFELQAPSMIQLGTWKEMTIAMRSTLPNGRVVRSEPVIGNIDNPFEFYSNQLFTFAGPVLDVAAFIVTIYYFSTGVIFFQDPFALGCVVGLALSGIAINIAQQFITYLIAASEERRWSELYAQAIQQHAIDLATAQRLPAPPQAPAGAPPVVRPALPPQGPPPQTRPPPNEIPLEVPPPPDVLDPAEAPDLEDLRF